MGYYYHYTDKNGARGIRRSRMIKASNVDTGDAYFGKGVYFTRLNPATDKEVLAQNNWRRSYTADKLDFVIKVLFYAKNEKPKRINNLASRDIFLFKGSVHLDDMRGWTIERVRDNEESDAVSDSESDIKCEFYRVEGRALDAREIVVDEYEQWEIERREKEERESTCTIS